MSYKPPDQAVIIRFRASAQFRELVDDCVRLWKIHAAARGQDVASVDMSHFIRSTLTTAMVAEFEPYDGRPKTPEAWQQIEAAIKQALKSSKK